MEYKINYYRVASHPEVWFNDNLTSFNCDFIPEGYELREKDEHKKKRIVRELEIEEQNIESYKRYLSESEENIKKLKKELKDLG